LKIKPVKLNRSVYFRVPNDIADLIGIDAEAGVTLNLEEQDDKFLLIYSVTKSQLPKPSHQSLQSQTDRQDATGTLPLISVAQVAKTKEGEA